MDVSYTLMYIVCEITTVGKIVLNKLALNLTEKCEFMALICIPTHTNTSYQLITNNVYFCLQIKTTNLK